MAFLPFDALNTGTTAGHTEHKFVPCDRALRGEVALRGAPQEASGIQRRTYRGHYLVQEPDQFELIEDHVWPTLGTHWTQLDFACCEHMLCRFRCALHMQRRRLQRRHLCITGFENLDKNTQQRHLRCEVVALAAPHQ